MSPAVTQIVLVVLGTGYQPLFDLVVFHQLSAKIVVDTGYRILFLLVDSVIESLLSHIHVNHD